MAASEDVRVQIPDRLAFGAQGTDVLVRDDLTGEAVDLVALRRCPAAQLVHTLQQASQDLGIFADADEADRLFPSCTRATAGAAPGGERR
ncbi:hypothetical protein XH79_01325 [Bradyrhizobium sp. CCBAU 45389]|nr:hypothetical protein [Bradyrhizobium sp. CCBAU 45389]